MPEQVAHNPSGWACGRFSQCRQGTVGTSAPHFLATFSGVRRGWGVAGVSLLRRFRARPGVAAFGQAADLAGAAAPHVERGGGDRVRPVAAGLAGMAGGWGGLPPAGPGGGGGGGPGAGGGGGGGGGGVGGGGGGRGGGGSCGEGRGGTGECVA